MKILYFSNVNWNWIKQRPHFLSKAIAELGYDITFLSITPLFKQRKSNLKFEKDLKIRDLYVIPLSNKFAIIRKINFIIIKICLKFDFDVVVLTNPRQLAFLDYIGYSGRIIYDCMDNIPAFYTGKIRRVIEMEELLLCDKSELVVVSSSFLEEKVKQSYNIASSKIKLIRNALNKDLFNSNLKRVYLDHPNLMYVGTVDNWFDTDRVWRIAEFDQGMKIYIIGPIIHEMKNKLEHPNIILVGKVEHDSLLSYLLEADIFIVPFIVNDLVRGVDPVKFYEFIALNKPIVSSYWNELEHFKGKVEFYETDEDLKQLIVKMKDKRLDGIIDHEFINDNSWFSRAQTFTNLLEIRGENQ